MVQIFGIRHHGPGSSKTLEAVFSEWQPDCILIEGPADGHQALYYSGEPDLTPPVAILIYNPANLSQAAYLPFASFSPEWIAMQYGGLKDIPVRLIDLPMAYQFSIDNDQQTSLDLNQQLDATEQSFARDPMLHLAKLAGYADTERWWEVTFEASEHPTEVFETIANMIATLRESMPDLRSDTLRREAFMRSEIRKAIKEGFKKIAVVCGAWHVPELKKFDTITAKSDKSFLKGIKKIKTIATWISWSYERLTFYSGYGAGIRAPAWYELLYQHRQTSVSTWMARVVQLLREEDMEASTANAVEAVRLAETLATLRHLPIAGIDEMK